MITQSEKVILPAGIVVNYPNLTAEYEVGNCHISLFASHANVTPELMQEILYGGEAITLSEIRRLRSLLDQYGKPCAYGYLLSPMLATIDPVTNKGKARTAVLRVKLDTVHSITAQIDKLDILQRWALQDAEDALSILCEGRLLPYAQYRQAIGSLNRFIRDTDAPRPRGLARAAV